MKSNIKKIVFAGAMTFVVIIACEKKLNVLDTNNPTQESYFKTASELQNGVNAAYSSIRSGQIMGREWFFNHDMRGGETASGGVQLEQPRAELLNLPKPSEVNAVMSDLWSGVYRMINRTNLVISKAPGVTDNTTLRDRVVGEAKFLRAWGYFELVSQWGPVPMYTEPVNSSTGFKGAETEANIYNLIISDLTDATTKLPTSYSGNDIGRATKYAALAMLGRVNMQKGDYAAAKTALLQVYGKFTLAPKFLWNFDGDYRSGSTTYSSGHEFNSESIFEVAFYDKGSGAFAFNWGYNGEGSTGETNSMRSQEYSIVWGNVIPSDRILNEFEPGDPRYKFTFFEAGDKVNTKQDPSLPGEVMTAGDMNVAASTRNGVTLKRVYRKYNYLDWAFKDGTGNLIGWAAAGFNQRVIRYAEVLLMLAECEAEVGTPAQAAAYINEVRDRPDVMMPHVNPATKNDALKAVMHERAVELAGEELANIDILRWRKKGYFTSLGVTDPKPGQEMFPIPLSEKSTNPLVK
jgi:starch-binding outer membrane protein, SusD/RagB family